MKHLATKCTVDNEMRGVEMKFAKIRSYGSGECRVEDWDCPHCL